MRKRLLSSGLAGLAAGTLLLAAGPLYEPLIRDDSGPSETRKGHRRSGRRIQIIIGGPPASKQGGGVNEETA
jgi:hypothetical protein